MSQQLELLTENPSQWTVVTYITPEIHKKQIKPFVALALKELEGNPDSRLASLMNADKYAAVRAVVRHAARQKSASKEPWNQDDVRTFVEGLRFSPECVEELTSLLCTEQIYDNIPTHLRVKPGLAGLQWKIDLSLSQSNLQDKLSPHSKEVLRRTAHVILTLSLTDGSSHTYRLCVTKFHELSQSNLQDKLSPQSKEVLRRTARVILTLSLTDGSSHTYRLCVTKFHELRYVVASALKSMIVLEKRKCMRKD